MSEPVLSIDPPRRVFRVPAADGRSNGVAFDRGVLAVAAQLLGAGQWLLDTSVAYAKQRKQYGRAIGEYQAIKHRLADVATRLELARPLLHGAAVAGETFATNVMEGVIVAHLMRREISAEQYRRAVEGLAARDDQRHPMSVPGDEV